MSTHKDGGPAFGVAGMSLRDYFAAQALAYICHWNILADTKDEDAELTFQNAAAFSYRMADAMLKAREQ